MPRDGALLVGYLGEDDAMRYMKDRCSYSFTHNESVLRSKWVEACQKVQEPVPWLHATSHRDIPPDLKHLADFVEQDEDFAEIVGGLDYEFQIIKLAPIL